MPLVVPGVMTSMSSSDPSSSDPSANPQQTEWMTKLLGKKLADTNTESSFAKQDLPKEHRVLEPGTMASQEHRPERLSIHVGEDGTVKHVEYK